MFRLLVWITIGLIFTHQAWAGTIAAPSNFVLHRPLNPALITSINEWGLAYGEGSGNRNLFNTAPSNCELKGFSECQPETSAARLAYLSGWEMVYFQVESRNSQKVERDVRDSTSLRFNQSEYDSIASLGFKLSFVSFGVYQRNTELHVREQTVDVNTGIFSRELTESSSNQGIGFSVNLVDTVYLAYFEETPTLSQSKQEDGASFDRVNTEGFKGGGVGFFVEMSKSSGERRNGIMLDFFHLTSISKQGEELALTGLDLELSVDSFVFYSSIINDNNNNYFQGELLRNNSVSFATGIGWDGDHMQFMIGRDPRYFLGIDGGALIMLGFQF